MARVLNLANYNRTTVIDLINGTFKIDKYSWVTSTTDARIRYDYTPFGAQPSFEYYQPVAEVFTLTSCIGGAAALKALHQIQDVMEGVRRYHDGTPTVESWWLEWNTEDEEPKRALIYTMTLDFPVTREVTSNFMECYGADIRMALTRHPLWETITAVTLSDEDVDNTGGIMALGTVPGTAPGRVHEIVITPVNAPVPDLVEHWVGIRPTHSGTTGFTALWQLEAGTLGTDAALASDGAPPDIASPAGVANNRLLITPGTATLVERVSVSLSQVEPTASERINYIGRYLVLLRSKVSSGTWGIQMRSGYIDELIHEEIYTDNITYFYLHELGEVVIPPWSWHFMAKADFVTNFTITLYAERVSGAGTLTLDALILIPTEHFLYLNGSLLDLVTDNIWAQTIENDTNVAYQTNTVSGLALRSIEQIPRLWYIPPESGVLVYAGQGATAHTLSYPVKINLNYKPRWLAHRYD